MRLETDVQISKIKCYSCLQYHVVYTDNPFILISTLWAVNFAVYLGICSSSATEKVSPTKHVSKKKIFFAHTQFIPQVWSTDYALNINMILGFFFSLQFYIECNGNRFGKYFWKMNISILIHEIQFQCQECDLPISYFMPHTHVHTTHIWSKRVEWLMFLAIVIILIAYGNGFATNRKLL